MSRDGRAGLSAAGGGRDDPAENDRGRRPGPYQGLGLVGISESLKRRQATFRLGRRLRRDPQAYLRSLEDSLINQTLPS